MAFPPSSPADQADNLPVRAPELLDADYFREVLRLPDGATDADIEHKLATRATELGIQRPVSRFSTVEEQNTSGDASPHTAVSNHGRTSSTSSSGSTNTALTSQISSSKVIPATLTESANLVVTRKRSKTLTFSHYEKYLSHLDPALSQPKFIGPHAAKTERPGNGVFSADRRKLVVQDFKRTLARRLRKRKQSSASAIV